MVFNKLKSTLAKVASSPIASKASVSVKPALFAAKTAAMSNPYTASALIGGTVVMGALTMNKKNTLGAVSNKVEEGVVGAVSSVGRVGSSVSSGFTKLLMPVMVIGGLACLFMILKK